MLQASALPLADLDAPGVEAEALHEHLDVDPAVIAPVQSPLAKVQNDKKYVDFINELYKGDKSKEPLHVNK